MPSVWMLKARTNIIFQKKAAQINQRFKRDTWEGHKGIELSPRRDRTAERPPIRWLPLLPALFALVALVLAFLCMLAGSRPGYMDEYAILTVRPISTKVTEHSLSYSAQYLLHWPRPHQIPSTQQRRPAEQPDHRTPQPSLKREPICFQQAHDFLRQKARSERLLLDPHDGLLLRKLQPPKHKRGHHSLRLLHTHSPIRIRPHAHSAKSH